MRTAVFGSVAVACLALLWVHLCPARPVQMFDYGAMAAKADLVVIATPVAVRELEEVRDLPGVSGVRVVGLETTFEVSVCFKGEVAQGDGDEKQSIVLHHYRPVDPKVAEHANAPALLHFVPGDRSQYLMFLKRADDGRYEPFNGQTDPQLSVEKLRIPKLSG